MVVVALAGWAVRGAGASDLLIAGVRLTTEGNLRVEHVSEAGSYFVLEAGSSVQALTQPVRLALGADGTGLFEMAPGSDPARFFRLRRVPLTEPLDVDRDGIDDVYELRHPRVLDPLNAGDAGGDFDGDGRSNLGEYRDGTDPESGGWIGGTWYVVDDPPAGSTTHFSTLSNAVARLRATMPAGESGRILVATATPQSVETLDLGSGALDLGAADGFAGRVTLRGAGVGPLTLRAAGGFGLRGIHIESPGGLQVIAGRRLALHGNRLPATVLTVGGGAGLHAGSAPHGVGPSSVTVGDCVCTGPLRLQWFGGAGADATLGLTGNSASVIDATVQGSFGGQATLQGNITERLSLTFDALASAQVLLSQMANLEQLSFAGEITGRSTVTVSEVLAGAVSLNFGGLGSVFLTVGGVGSRALTINAGAADSEIEISELRADDLVLDIRPASGVVPRVRERVRQAEIRAGISVNAWDAEQGQVDLGLALVNASTLELRTRAFTRLELSDRVTLTGQLRATVEADVLALDSVQARLEGGLQVSASGVGAGVMMTWQGGVLRGNTDIDCAPGIWVGLTLDETVFDPGGAFSVHGGGGESLSGMTSENPRLLDLRSGEPSAGPGDRSIVLRGLTQAPGSVLVADVESPVTIEGCSFRSSGFTPVVLLEGIGGAIRIEGCRFEGQGLGIARARGDVVVSGNEFRISAIGFPALGIQAASATIATNDVSGEGVAGLGLDVTGQATLRELRLSGDFGVTLGSGETSWEGGRVGGVTSITGGRVRARGVEFGNVIMIGGTGRLGLDDCGLAGVVVADFNESGGLLNDPTASGALPEDVYSAIDFDGDDRHCADYPPPQIREDTGDCVRPGVPPPP